MQSTGIKMLCRFLIASFLLLQLPLATAGMVGAEQVLSATTVQADRTAVNGVLTRADVTSQLQAMGVDPKLAQDRVAAMTNDEVHTLAGKMNSLPAGALWDGGWIVLVIVVGLLVYFNWK